MYLHSIKNNVSEEGNFKNFAYSNYTKMVYRKVLGTTVKKYKELNNIAPNKNISDYFDNEQLEQVQDLESKIAAYIEMRSTGTDNKEVYAEVKKYVDSL